MCEVWKWIMVAADLPLVALYLYGFPYTFLAVPGGKRWERFVQQVRPYARFIALDAFVAVFSTAIFLIHCAS